MNRPHPIKKTNMAKKLEILVQAPDFELTDTQGRALRLSELWKERPVVLVLLRGFT